MQTFCWNWRTRNRRCDPPPLAKLENVKKVNRTEAQTQVDAVTTRIEQFAAVSLEDAAAMLGPERFAAMRADRLRSQGPREGYVYPWNVVDYLDEAGPFVAWLKKETPRQARA